MIDMTAYITKSAHFIWRKSLLGTQPLKCFLWRNLIIGDRLESFSK